MSDPNYPMDLNKILGEFNRRIKNLESRNTMQNTHITAYLENNTPNPGIETVAKFGDLGDGSVGVEIGSQLDNPALRVDNLNGISFPQIPLVFYDSSVTQNVTVADLELRFSGTMVSATHSGLLLFISITCPATTTADVWLASFSSAGTILSDHQACAANTTTLVRFDWLHQIPLGETGYIFIHVGRTSGAGTVVAHIPEISFLVGPEHCSTSGLFV